MISPIADSDPDPTTQLPWPSARVRQTPNPMPSSNDGAQRNVAENFPRTPVVEHTKRLLTTWDLITLSIAMAGSQVAWTVELG